VGKGTLQETAAVAAGLKYFAAQNGGTRIEGFDLSSEPCLIRLRLGSLLVLRFANSVVVFPQFFPRIPPAFVSFVPFV